jgi:hypothetical protein
MAVAILLCCTIVGIAPGVALMGFTGAVVAAESQRYIKRQVAWEMSEKGAERFREGRGKRNAVLIKLDADVEEYEYDPDLDQMVPIEKPWVE